MRLAVLGAMGGIMDRLLIAASYGALREGTMVLQTVVATAATRDIFQLVCTFLFFLLAIKFKTLEVYFIVCFLWMNGVTFGVAGAAERVCHDRGAGV